MAHKTLRIALKLWALLYPFGMATLFQYVWLMAFLHNNVAWIDINHFGEAMPEYFITAICYAAAFIGTYLLFKDGTIY
jgi:hypothetical protein